MFIEAKGTAYEYQNKTSDYLFFTVLRMRDLCLILDSN
jgi:hypothetical protein